MNYNVFYYIPNTGGFYRKIAKSDHKQYPVYSSSDIKNLIWQKEAVYATISIFKDQKILPYYFFYDFDCDKATANKEINKLISFCDRTSFPYSVTEPKRGFHFYIHIAPIEMNSKTFSFLSNHIIASSGIENYDDQVDGVINGISRLPGSYYPDIKRRVRIIKQKLYSFKSPLDLLDKDVYIPTFDQTNESRIEGGMYRPCVDHFIRDVHPSQLIRFSWAAIRVSQGKNDIEILNEARSYNWEDFEENYTLLQIHQIRRKNYMIPSCGTLRKAGYCANKLCNWRQHIKNE